MSIFDTINEDTVEDEKSLATKEDLTFLKKFEKIEAYFFEWAKVGFGNRWLTTRFVNSPQGDKFAHYQAGRIAADITPRDIEYFCKNTQLYHENLGSAYVSKNGKPMLTRPAFGLFISTLVQQSFDNGYNNFSIPLGPYKHLAGYEERGFPGFSATPYENYYTQHALVNTGHCLRGVDGNPIKVTYEGYSFHSQVKYAHKAHITYVESHKPSLSMWSTLEDCTIVLQGGVPHYLHVGKKPYNCTFIVPDELSAEYVEGYLKGKNTNGTKNTNQIFIEQNGVRTQHFTKWQRLKRVLNPFKKD